MITVISAVFRQISSQSYKNRQTDHSLSTGGGEDEALGCSRDTAAAGVDVERYEIQIHWN